VTYALLFFLGLVLVNAATLVSIEYYINQTTNQQLQVMDEAVAKEIKTIDDIPSIDLSNLSAIGSDIEINLIYKGASIYSTGDTFKLPQSEDKIIGTLNRGEHRIVYMNDTLIMKDGKKVTAQIVKELSTENQYLSALTIIMMVIDVIVFLVAIVVGFIISKKALSPIDNITNQAKAISASDLSARIRIEGPDDELRRLSDTFNDLISRIQLSYEKQRRFTLDASHELATPLAVIKGYTDLLDRWGKDDQKVLDESINSIKVEIKNMTNLLDTLLFLSKADNELYEMNLTRFELNDLIREIVKESNLVNDSHRIVCSDFPKIQIKADRQLIKQMLRALIDNSIKYSMAGTVVGIEYKKAGKYAVIEISDHGCGIPKAELLNIFDRFYRVDKSRSRSIGGAGLGLSLVKWIVDIHKGTVRVDSEVGKGTKVTVTLHLKL
jgi:signal transduction histidine kinase